MTVDLMPKFILGTVQPRGVAGHQPYQFYRVVPRDVMMISAPLGLGGYTRAAAEEAFSRFWDRADELAQAGAQRIVQIGVPPAAFMGRDFIVGLVADIEKRYGVRGGADIEMAIGGMKRLGVQTIALGGLSWTSEVNDVIAGYLEEADIHVVGHTAWPERAENLQAGLDAVLEIGRATHKAAPNADGVFLPGGPWPTMHAVPILEEELGKPVFVNMQGLIWATLREPGVIPPVEGWGRLLALAT